ncbi:MAG: TolC family outer membrane protein, partial [Alphaproteobacteria bacterium]|nr:TolC family outer membrane protein [Alphaproteobacteria bacterium]
VFNGFGTITATRSADANIVAERERLRGVEQDVLLQTITTYMDVVRDTAVLKLSENNVEVLGKQLQATNDRFSVGEVTKTDVAQSQARQSRATSDRIQAEGNLISSTAQQEKLVGEKPVDLKMPERLPAIPATFEEAQARALAANPLLTRADHLQKAAGHDSYTARSRILPTVAIVGEMRRDDGSSINRGSSYENDSITVTASIPLYQSGEEYSRIRQADRTNERRKEEVNDTRNQVIQNITQAWQQVQTARATIKSNTDSVKAAEIALDGVKQENQYGARTTLDVLDAEQELFQARVNLVRAQRDEVVAVYTLLAAMGDLSARNLQLPVQYYDPEKNYRRVKWKFIGW